LSGGGETVIDATCVIRKYVEQGRYLNKDEVLGASMPIFIRQLAREDAAASLQLYISSYAAMRCFSASAWESPGICVPAPVDFGDMNPLIISSLINDAIVQYEFSLDLSLALRAL
jgi:hypothetical protein